jgi:hypothetical protein
MDSHSEDSEFTYISPVALFCVVMTAGPITPGIPVADIVHNTDDSLTHSVFSQLVKPILPTGESDTWLNPDPRI